MNILGFPEQHDKLGDSKETLEKFRQLRASGLIINPVHIHCQASPVPEEESMTIRDLQKDDEMEFCHCLESWSEEMAESGNHKEHWLARMKREGLGVKLAVTDDGKYAGMIQYYPARFSPAIAPSEDAWFIHCIWVHGYNKGQGNFQKKGIGKALLQAAEDDIRNRGGKIVLAWGLRLPFWMKSKWFRKNGYSPSDATGMQELVQKNLTESEISAVWRKPKKAPPAIDEKGLLQVTTFMSGACTVTAIAYERLRKVINGLPVNSRLIDSSLPRNLDEWGLSDVMFIGSKKVFIGPPPSTQKLHRILVRELKKIR